MYKIKYVRFCSTNTNINYLLIPCTYVVLCSVHGNSPGKNIGVGCHAFLQGMFPIQGLIPGHLHCRKILYQPSHQGSSGILEWVSLLKVTNCLTDVHYSCFSFLLLILYQLSYEEDSKRAMHCIHSAWSRVSISYWMVAPTPSLLLLLTLMALRLLKSWGQLFLKCPII